MDEKLLYWIWLNSIKGVGPVTAKLLLKKFKEPKAIYTLDKIDLLETKGVGKVTVEAIINSRDLTKSEEILNRCHKLNIKIVTYDDNLYPSQVKEYDKSPIMLYYKGNLNFDTRGIAIVGSRRCSEYGKKIAIEVGHVLAKNNVTVISGMAKGIDSYAHTSCINESGNTIAVLGCGVDICYPKEHIKLMDKIINQGAVISEYQPNTMPNGKFFPKRNSIIAALSSKILVVEATEKSGAIITADYGFKMKKEVFAVPNGIYEIGSMGCNKLIYKGAKIYIDSSQLLQGMENNVQKYEYTINNDETLSREEQKIINTLYKKPHTVDEIVFLTKIHKQKIQNLLFNLELNGIISMTAGMYELIPDSI